MKFEQIVIPTTLSEAYTALKDNKESILLAGGAFIKLQKRSVNSVIDLSNLDLNYIRLESTNIKIGAMTSIRQIEINEDLPTALKDSVKHIGGVALRNIATIGGSVCGKYPFSNSITALLALNAELLFFKKGKISLAEFIKTKYSEVDILIEIIVPRVIQSLYASKQLTYTDFPIINMAISKNNHLRISVGSRPMIATLLKDPNLNFSAKELLKTIEFKSDFKASGEYRRVLAESMLSESLKEVRLWK
ncbi:MAG: FAD binding domain-containing protein [Clostridiales bacterium]|nr:FAD binding domain-containing protein [Clostridiales bacterium]